MIHDARTELINQRWIQIARTVAQCWRLSTCHVADLVKRKFCVYFKAIGIISAGSDDFLPGVRGIRRYSTHVTSQSCPIVTKTISIPTQSLNLYLSAWWSRLHMFGQLGEENWWRAIIIPQKLRTSRCNRTVRDALENHRAFFRMFL